MYINFMTSKYITRSVGIYIVHKERLGLMLLSLCHYKCSSVIRLEHTLHIYIGDLTIDKVKMNAVIVWAIVKLLDNAPTLNTKQAPAKFSKIKNNM